MANRLSSDPKLIQRILNSCEVCYLGMVDPDGKPYVLPFNFGFEDGLIYLHSAPAGRKIDILQKNPQVCISFSSDHQLFHRHEQVACSYGMKYRSVLAFGNIEFIDDEQEKIRVLNVIMEKYTGKSFSYNSPAVKNVCVFKLCPEEILAKESGY